MVSLLVLLVACANVATLFIGIDVSRRRELATRIALGATPPQLVRSVIVEALLTASIASLAGLGLGAVMLRVLVSQAQPVFRGSTVRRWAFRSHSRSPASRW